MGPPLRVRPMTFFTPDALKPHWGSGPSAAGGLRERESASVPPNPPSRIATDLIRWDTPPAFTSRPDFVLPTRGAESSSHCPDLGARENIGP